MKRGLVLVTLVAAILSLPAYLVWRALPAQTAMKTQLRLIDAGSVTNSSSGFGVFMKFEPEEMPKAGLRSLEPMLLAVCNEMGPQVVALVKNKSGEAEPNKIVIIVRSGGMIGTQLKVIYDWGDGGCK